MKTTTALASLEVAGEANDRGPFALVRCDGPNFQSSQAQSASRRFGCAGQSRVEPHANGNLSHLRLIYSACPPALQPSTDLGRERHPPDDWTECIPTNIFGAAIECQFRISLPLLGLSLFAVASRAGVGYVTSLWSHPNSSCCKLPGRGPPPGNHFENISPPRIYRRVRSPSLIQPSLYDASSCL